MKEVFPRSYAIPFIVGMFLMVSAIMTNGFSQSQDIRSRATYIYPTPTPYCTACTTQQGSCPNGFYESYCANDSTLNYNVCLESCSPINSYRSCETAGKTQKCERLGQSGCRNINYWSLCSSFNPTVTPFPSPTLKVKIISNSGSINGKSCYTVCKNNSRNCTSVGTNAAADNGKIVLFRTRTIPDDGYWHCQIPENGACDVPIRNTNTTCKTFESNGTSWVVPVQFTRCRCE